MAASSTTTTSNRTSRREIMGQNIGRYIPRVQRNTVASACIRLGQMTGESPKTWENRLNGERSIYRLVALADETLVAMGLTDEVAVRQAVIDAALAGTHIPDLVTAILTAAHADCAEDAAEAAYHADPCAETARALIQASAVERFRAEKREQALRKQWGLD